MKVFVEGNSPSYQYLFHRQDGYDVVEDVKDADFVCFIGGSDVDPSLYSEKNTHSFTSKEADYRSLLLALQAVKLNLPMVGICRGGQFINAVLHDGSMIQDIEGHGWGDHPIFYNNRPYEVTSSHHQEMIPGESATLVLRAPDGVVEVVKYEGALCFQGHPEWADKDHSCSVLFFELLEDMLFGEKSRVLQWDCRNFPEKII